MTSAIVQGGTDGLDAASFAKVTNFQHAKDAGADWLSFYVGGNYGVSKTQIEAAWQVGLPIMLNFERSASAALGGYRAGMDHAETAVKQTREMGFIGEAPIVFSGVDFGPTPNQIPTLDLYHRALVDMLMPINWQGGAYGPRLYLQHLAQQDWWPDDWPLWHWGGDGYVIYEWAWCKQWFQKKPKTIGEPLGDMPYPVDENSLLHPMKFWTGYGPNQSDPLPPPIPPVVKDEQMSYFRYSPDGWVAEIEMGYKQWVNGDYFYGAIGGQLRGSGVPSTTGIYAEPCSKSFLEAIPDRPAGLPAVVDNNAIAQAVRDKLRNDPLK